MGERSTQHAHENDEHRRRQPAPHQKRLHHIIGQTNEDEINRDQHSSTGFLGHPDPDDDREQDWRRSDLDDTEHQHSEGKHARVRDAGNLQARSGKQRLQHSDSDHSLGDGADIAGTLSNVNGKITLTGAHVGGGIKTVNGGMNITGASRVEGGILVTKPSSDLLQLVRNVPRIVIGPGATVQGELRFERTVQLYVSDKATIGTVTGATPITFTGDAPPK